MGVVLQIVMLLFVIGFVVAAQGSEGRYLIFKNSVEV
jgi:hypothetical protein